MRNRLTRRYVFSKTLTNLNSINNLNARTRPLSINRHILFKLYLLFSLTISWVEINSLMGFFGFFSDNYF